MDVECLGVKGASIAPCSWRYCSESMTGVNILRTESEVVVYSTKSSLHPCVSV